MERITKNDKVIGFIEEPKEVTNFVPQGAPDKFKMLGGTDRALQYGSDLYIIEKSSKKKGYSEGDICYVCSIGEMKNLGGCFTCSNCNIQLKCGL